MRMSGRWLTSAAALNVVFFMPVPQPPIASLLAWLTVSVLLLAGAPTHRAGAGANGAQLQTAADELAQAATLLRCASGHDAARAPAPKFREAMAVPVVVRLAVSGCAFSRHPGQRHPGAAPLMRPSLVGTVELRI